MAPLTLHRLLFVAGLATAAALAVPPPAAAKRQLRAVVSFDLAAFWDADVVRERTAKELQEWLRGRLSTAPAAPLDVYACLGALQEEGSEFGFLKPGLTSVLRGAIAAATVGSGVAEDESGGLADEAIAEWLQAHDSHAEQLLAPAVLPALSALSDARIACCGLTDSLSASERMPSLVSALDFTQSTYDFTVGADERWDVAFQVVRLTKYPPGMPWIHVAAAGAAGGGGLAQAAKLGLKTVAVGGGAAGGAEPSVRIGSLEELPRAVEGLL